MKKTKLFVISHTHWDREWYQTFQAYRYRLVRMMDDLLENLEKTPDFKTFHLDGQFAPVEDYLEIRPENRERLAKLVHEGRILLGPWYVMPDEFLVSGEAIVKNLQTGRAACRAFGTEPMANGYVTDIFGHNSQFPQVLSQFDIPSATLYRGIADFDKDAFRWKSPDGSEVAVTKLERNRCYSNFYFTVRWPYEKTEFDKEDAIRRMKDLVEYSREHAATDMIVMMDGVDHIDIEPEMPKMLRMFEENIPDVEFVHTSITDYFDQLDTSNLEVLEGNLYHVGEVGVNNQVLKNVLSSMVHLKQSNDRCETQLTRYTEPLNAFTEIYADEIKLFGRNDYTMSPRRTYIDKSWKYLLLNQPHDSICGCSVSDVHRDNEYRFRQSEQISGIAADDCMRVIARNIKAEDGHQASFVLYNPSQRPIEGVTLVDLAVPKSTSPFFRFYDAKGQEIEGQVISEDDTFVCKHRLRQLIEQEVQSLLHTALNVSIPALGYTVVHCDNWKHGYIDDKKKSYFFEEFTSPKRVVGSMMPAHNVIDNGLLKITVNSDGTLTVFDKETEKQYTELLRFEDCGDNGDGWNYRKPAYDSKIYSGEACTVSIESDGPFACVIKVSHVMTLPKEMAGLKRSSETISQKFDTYVTVLKNDPVLHFRTEMDNVTPDHRLRVCFPTNLDTDCFYTKTPFDMSRWDIKAEDYATRIETETFVHPMQGVAYMADDKNGVGLFSKGLYEVEVTDNEEKAFALTLMRAHSHETGTVKAEDSRMLRSLTFEYAVSFGCKSPADALVSGEQYRAPVLAQAFTPNPEADTLACEDTMLGFEGEGVVLSGVYQNNVAKELPENAVIVRFYDVSGKEGSVRLSLRKALNGAKLLDLDGNVLEDLPVDKNGVDVPFGAHRIVTAALY